MRPIRGIWITWERQGRNEGISEAIGWRLNEILYKGTSRLIRYIYCTARTIAFIAAERPDVVAVQNPSIILTGIVLLARSFFGYTVVVDAHNAGIFPREGRSWLLRYVARWAQRWASLTIVTNDELKAVVEKNGGRALVLPDRIPPVRKGATPILPSGFNILLISTFADDEPYKAVLEAAASMPKDRHIHVTGRYAGRVDERHVPDSVSLLGFVSEEEFWGYLKSVDAVMDLTFRESCLLRGAYEAVAAGKPMILSDTRVLRSYFSQGCVYVQPTATSIAAGIETSVRDYDANREKIEELKGILERDWEKRLECLHWAVEELVALRERKGV